MANIQERRDKEGKLISFSIRVYRGRGADGKQLKPATTTFDVKPTWKEETARKKATEFAATFEEKIKKGLISDNKQKFASYCDYVISLKEQRGELKHTTAVRYRELTQRIYAVIGHLRITDVRTDILNDFYTSLAADGMNKRTGGGLSAKTIIEHHRLISSVLAQAVKEGLLPYNVAERTTLPKMQKKDVNYFQPEQVEQIRNALENEPIKWKTIVHLFLITGARRGEILGLKWKNVDFEKNQIYICNNVLYTSDRGIYEDTPKTEKSIRYIALPKETMMLLQQYRAWQNEYKLSVGKAWKEKDFVFTQEDGEPMHPDSVTDWLKKFSKRNNLPHINPHAFRHTMASILYYNGVDTISISKRLGHAQPSTTANIYAHVIEQADKENADIIANVFLKKA